MTLPRRTFLGLMGAALPVGASAFDLRSGSGSSRPSEPPPGSVGRLSAMLMRGKDNRNFFLTSLLVLADGGAWYAAFQRRVVQRDEDRIGILRDIPLLGQLFAPSLRSSDFSASRQIGLSLRLGETLIVDLHRSQLSRQQLAHELMSGKRLVPALQLPNAAEPVQSVGVANQKISYFLVGGPAPVNLDSPPAPFMALSQGAQAEPIGRAFNSGKLLLVSVSPSILTGWS